MMKTSFWIALVTSGLLLLSACSPENNSAVTPAAAQPVTQTPDLAATASYLETRMAEDTHTPVPPATPTRASSETPVSPNEERLSPARLTRLLEYGVRTLEDENLGQIADILLNLDASRATYVLLDTSGIFDLEQNIIPLPWEILEFEAVAGDQALEEVENTFFSAAESAKIENAPSLDLENMPDMTDPDWDLALWEYWEDSLESRPTQPASEPVATESALEAGALAGDLLAQEFLTFTVQNAAGEQVGAVKDAVLQVLTGEVNYVMISSGGVLGIGEKWIPVPPDLLRADREAGALTFQLSVEGLMNAPNYDLNQLPETGEPGWDAEIVEYWDSLHVEE